jgi:hypothetical protein
MTLADAARLLIVDKVRLFRPPPLVNVVVVVVVDAVFVGLGCNGQTDRSGLLHYLGRCASSAAGGEGGEFNPSRAWDCWRAMVAAVDASTGGGGRSGEPEEFCVFLLCPAKNQLTQTRRKISPTWDTNRQKNQICESVSL